MPRFFVGGLPVLNPSTGLPCGFVFVDFPGSAENAGVRAFLAHLRAAELGGRRFTIMETPELGERFAPPTRRPLRRTASRIRATIQRGLAQRPPPAAAGERAALASWDDDGGRNAP